MSRYSQSWHITATWCAGERGERVERIKGGEGGDELAQLGSAAFGNTIEQRAPSNVRLLVHPLVRPAVVLALKRACLLACMLTCLFA